MVYIDIKKETSPICDRITIDESDIEISNIVKIDTDNWGDDDCPKMVTTVSAIDIKIKENVASKFNEIKDIMIIRYNYYNPAYHLNCHQQSCETQPDGSLLLKYA